jgi:transposase
MADGARLLRPQRSQLTWDLVDLDSQLDPDHRARLVWDFVKTLDLSALEAAVKARDDVAGRPASDPRVVLAVWLYATAEGIGSARAIERLCRYHAAYRWLCGGVPINHNLLSEFRRTQGDLLDRLLSDSLTALIAEGLLALDEVIIDGTKVAALAGRGSMVQKPKLDQLAVAVGERVAELKREVESDAAGADRKQQKRRLRQAEEKAARIQRAQERMAELEREKAARAKQHAKAEAEKAAPSVSVSDPEVRLMKMPDGARRPAWNVQVATSHGFVVTIEPTDRRNDSGLAAGLVQQVAERLLADGSAMTQDEIVSLAASNPKLEVFSPPAKESETVSADTLRKRVWKHAHEPAAVKAWRERMASEAGKAVYRRRKLTEHVHAKMKNHGFGRMLVHGKAVVRNVCLLHALVQNLMNALWLRRAALA